MTTQSGLDYRAQSDPFCWIEGEDAWHSLKHNSLSNRGLLLER